MPSIKEVAKKAKVSVATVSRVLNNSSSVKEETSKKVMKVIEEMNYTPNMLGVNLRNSSNNLIIVTVPVISNPFYSALVDGITNCASYHGYNILIAVTNGVLEKEIEYYEMARFKLADGVLALTTAADADTFNEYAAKVPIVRCCYNPEGANTTIVSIDNEQAIYEMVTYLYKLGRRHIAFMGISKDAESGLEPFYREKGYRRAMNELGLDIQKDLIINSNYEYYAGIEECKSLINTNLDIDAIVCATDVIALNTVRTLQDLGKIVPDDVCVTGFDNSTYSLISLPQITSIDQASYETGYRAMESLYQHITGEKVDSEVICVPHRIVERESTNPERKNKE